MSDTVDDVIDTLCAAQSPGGAFVSFVELACGDVEDRNLFVTALVLRELSAIRHAHQLPTRLDDTRARALRFLARSHAPLAPRTFAFWPHQAHPFWMPQALYPDADDTAVIALELVRAGIWPADTLDVVIDHLDQHRARLDDLVEPSQHIGAFVTWLRNPGLPNTIDVGVNTNVLALLAAHGRHDAAGYDEAVATVIDGVSWLCADGPLTPRIRRIAPYYPNVAELVHALAHAVAAGAHELTASHELLTRRARTELADDPRAIVCSSPDGVIVWRAPVLHAARRLRLMLSEKDTPWLESSMPPPAAFTSPSMAPSGPTSKTSRPQRPSTSSAGRPSRSRTASRPST